jgi:hypothetical protein
MKTWVILHKKLRLSPNAGEEYVTQIQSRVYCDNVNVIVVSEKSVTVPQNFF